MNEINLINDSIDKYNPFRVYALFSGGNDSVCASHLASQAKQFNGVVFIDTGIALMDAMPRARSIAEGFGWEFIVARTPKNYEDIVMKYGFPGPSAHRYMYISLKERAIQKLFRETKTNRNQRIVLITGVRQHESKRRLETVKTPIVKEGSRVWISPMWKWTSEQKESYMQEYQLPHNPFKDIIHISGDCLCGAYNDKGDLEMLKAFFPEDAKKIIALQEKVIKKFPWTWEEQPPSWWGIYQKGQQFLGKEFMPLCWNCDLANSPTAPARPEKP